jgi:hypothetical protein
MSNYANNKINAYSYSHTEHFLCSPRLITDVRLRTILSSLGNIGLLNPFSITLL